MSPWKVIGAAVRGPDHEQTGDPCQDAFAHASSGTRLVAAVSDGAGSARFSDRGARRLCEVIVSELLAFDMPLPRHAQGDTVKFADWAEHAARTIAMVRDEFAYEIAQGAAPADDASLRDYAATLVACVAEPEGGLFFHIGDGAAAALSDTRDLTASVLSRPENGAYANETYFFTGADWRERLRVTPFGPSALIMLVSDGATPFTLAERFEGVEPRFVAPVTTFLETAEPQAGARALAATLDRPDARRISGDDKSLVWIRRCAA